MILKYIIVEKNSSPVIFQNYLLHCDVAKAFGKIRSAGFCTLSCDGERLIVKCFGESSTLKIISNPIEDQKLIEKLFTVKNSKLIAI